MKSWIAKSVDPAKSAEPYPYTCLQSWIAGPVKTGGKCGIHASLSGKHPYPHIFAAMLRSSSPRAFAQISEALAELEARGALDSAEVLKRVSPVAWQHINFYGRYQFDADFTPIDFAQLRQQLSSEERPGFTRRKILSAYFRRFGPRTPFTYVLYPIWTPYPRPLHRTPRRRTVATIEWSPKNSPLENAPAECNLAIADLVGNPEPVAEQRKQRACNRYDAMKARQQEQRASYQLKNRVREKRDVRKKQPEA